MDAGDRLGPVSDVLVLCYHGVSPEWPSELAVSPELLERQLRGLLERGYRGSTFTAALSSEGSEHASERGRRRLVITFDDALRSVSTLAAPILANLGLVGTVFVSTAFIGSEQPVRWPGVSEWSDGPWAHELLPMDRSELLKLAETGWEIGSHTHTHPHLTQLDDVSLEYELGHSRAVCEQLMDHPCPALAYPYGDHDRRVIGAAAAAGYSFAATLPRRLHAPTPLAWPRIYVDRADSAMRFRVKVSLPMRRLRSSVLWPGEPAGNR